MDTLRGEFSDQARPLGDLAGYDPVDDDAGHEPPPLAIGQDERRMQVRAYNFWAAMLDDRSFPSIEQLDFTNLPDFGPNSVLLDFTQSVEEPKIGFLGDKLAEECGAEGEIHTLADVPSRSLLSRITDHYMQILANQAPIGFEAEFVNQRGSTILYRGILLPFASNDDRIDFIYGVINWKELADQKTTDELLLQIDQALETRSEPSPSAAPLVEWADGPADISDVLDLVSALEDGEDTDFLDWPTPSFGGDGDIAPLPGFRSLADTPAEGSVEPAPSTLADQLAEARELAYAAQGTEDRSRHALYAAIGRAFDFSLAAAEAPAEFAEMIADAGIAAQERAPMTPVVKLVFGVDYDKTRLAEYGTALIHGHRLRLAAGDLEKLLAQTQGGLKGIVAEERRLRRAENGKTAAPRTGPREAIARKLRKLEHAPIAAIASEGSEFALLVARRLSSGEVVLLGEVSEDDALLERAARRLLS
ncbi:MAG TPA: hypothetical protein VGE05_13770 [Novosphingobium sp.]